MNSRASAPIALRLIDLLRSSQHDLQCEWSMNAFEVWARSKEFESPEAEYLAHLAIQKRHYLMVYFILFPFPHLNIRPIPAFYSALLHPSPTPVLETGPVPSFPTIAILAAITDPCILDAFTFTLLPLFCDYFHTELGIDRFLETMRDCSDQPPLFTRLARVAVFSPPFLLFISRAFRPALTPYMSPLVWAPYAATLSSAIQSRCRTNSDRVPLFVSKMLSLVSNETAALVLSQAFFEPALDNPAVAHASGLIEFSEAAPPALLKVLRQVLTGPALQPIAALMRNLSVQTVPVLTETDREELPALFQRLLLCQFDFAVADAIEGRRPLMNPDEYKLRAVLQEGEAPAESVHNELEKTMGYDVARVEAHLRHLLQLADPIPLFREPPSMDIETFFMEYLVRRGSRDGYWQRSEQFESLRDWKKLKTEQPLIAALRSVGLERVKEKRALSAVASIRKTCTAMDAAVIVVCQPPGSMKMDSLGFVDAAFCAFVLEQHFEAGLAPILAKRTFKAYVKDPAKLKADWTAVHKLFATEPGAIGLGSDGLIEERADHPMLRVMFGMTTRLYDFENFRRNWSEHRSQDAKLSAEIERHRYALILEEVKHCPKQYAWIMDCFRELEEREDILEGLRLAALESSPLRKCREFGHWIRVGLAFLQERAPATEKWGGDEYMPLSAAVCILANPPHILSNCQYIELLCEFDFMNDIVTLTKTVLRVVATLVLGDKAPAIVRPR
jgi:hypothetical protein